jgi:hypothetical protein
MSYNAVNGINKASSYREITMNFKNRRNLTDLKIPHNPRNEDSITFMMKESDPSSGIFKGTLGSNSEFTVGTIDNNNSPEYEIVETPLKHKD